jgi:hypothetical protein
MPKRFTKQPGENKDYDFNYTDWMPASDSISTSVVTADAGISLGTKTQTVTVVKQFISGGTAGTDYKVTCTITTAQGRIDQKEITILVREF